MARAMLGTRGQMNSWEALLCFDFDAVIVLSHRECASTAAADASRFSNEETRLEPF